MQATGFTYKMVQIPPGIVLQKQSDGAAAAYLQNVVNSMADDGWEFYRVDPIGVSIQPGCLGFLMGRQPSNTTYHVITFRRPA